MTMNARPDAIAPVPLPDLEAVDRAVAELRRGGAVVILGCGVRGTGAALVRAAETVDIWPAPHFTEAGVGQASLVITGRRAAVLGLTAPSAQAVQLGCQDLQPARIRTLIDPDVEAPVPPPDVGPAVAVAASDAGHAGVQLAKIARLLPAVILAPLSDNPDLWTRRHGRLSVGAAAIAHYDQDTASDLRPISEARVPLADCEDTRIISFRPRDGGAEHLAIILGAPDPSKPVLTRLHSECFTGDLLASLRCDCGDQLRGAISTIAKQGAGVLLYLAQEGRGIGLVNKLRAYTLQDHGFDTVDANEQLGFDDDERVYLPAVRMLRVLGFTSVRLLTNNPAKVGALGRHGIEVVERVAHAFPSNEHNWNYLQSKAKRSGHLF
ncbi:MAG: GTP cyclohydrolase II [Rhodospirillaceae bacterium]